MMKKTFLLFLFVLLFYSSPLHAMKPADVPNPRSTANIDVQDSANVLGSEYTSLINKVCEALEKATKTQMAVVTVDDLDGLTVEDYSLQVATRFGIGKKGTDNGILILFALNDRKVRIEVGYGLEGVLTDAKTKEFIQTFAIPRFKEKQYSRGLYDLSKALAETVAKSENVNLGIEDPQNFPAQMVTTRAAENDNTPSESESLKTKASVFSKNTVQVFVLISFGFTLFWLLLTTLKLKNKEGHAAKIVFLQDYYEYGFGSVWVFGFIAGALLAFIMDDPFPIIKAFFVSALGCWGLSYLYRKLMEAIISKERILCQKCHKPMVLLPENLAIKKMNEQERVEQEAGAMAYEFWLCTPCNTTEKIATELSLASTKKCPKCGWLSLKNKTRDLPGNKYLDIDDCLNPNCHYHKETEHYVSSSSSSSSAWSFGSSGGSSFSSGSFGGGSFGGGGSSGSW